MTHAMAMAERKYRNPQVNLRLPEELKNQIAKIADKNKRSANAEMVAAIDYWVGINKNNELSDVVEFATNPSEKLELQYQEIAKRFADSIEPYLADAVEKKKKEMMKK